MYDNDYAIRNNMETVEGKTRVRKLEVRKTFYGIDCVEKFA